MVLEFQDGMQLNIIGIYGGPQTIDGVERDVFRIVIPQNVMSKADLTTLFKDNPEKTNRLYTYGEVPDELGFPKETKILSGQGYNIFISIQEEQDVRRGIPGRLFKEVITDVYAIYMAQMTYDEYVQAFPDDPIEE